MSEGAAFERWKSSFRSPKTWENWHNYFEHYASWRKLNHEQLFEESKRTFNDPDPMVKREVEEKVKAYLRHLQDQKYAPGTIRTALNAIKSFYQYSSYETMGLSLKSLRLQRGVVIKSLPPTAEEIDKLLDFASLRERAMIALLAETGWGPELLVMENVEWIDRLQGAPS